MNLPKMVASQYWNYFGKSSCRTKEALTETKLTVGHIEGYEQHLTTLRSAESNSNDKLTWNVTCKT